MRLRLLCHFLVAYALMYTRAWARTLSIVARVISPVNIIHYGVTLEYNLYLAEW